MREIKFRVWSLEDKKMYYWDEYPLYSDELYFALTDKELYIPMQYVGFKDANKKEVYEGDIIMDWHGYKSVIEFKVYERSDEYTYVTYSVFTGPIYDSYFEIVGNIYENSDLLKEK